MEERHGHRRQRRGHLTSIPVIQVGHIAEISRIQIDHGATADRRRRCIDQRVDFEQDPSLTGHTDAFTVGQTEYFRVIQQLDRSSPSRSSVLSSRARYRIHVLHPQRINRSIEHEPLPMIDMMFALPINRSDDQSRNPTLTLSVLI